MTSHDFDAVIPGAPEQTTEAAGALDAGGPDAGQPADTEPTEGPGTSEPTTARDDELATLRAERDEHLDTLRRVSAEFTNFRRRAAEKETAAARRAEETLLRSLVLPVLDTLDAAHVHHPDVLDPVWRAATTELARAGLDRLDPLGKPFDPTEHDAVAVDGDGTGPGTVSAVSRAGYRWRGQLLRPAQVHVHHQPGPADEAQPHAEQT